MRMCVLECFRTPEVVNLGVVNQSYLGILFFLTIFNFKKHVFITVLMKGGNAETSGQPHTNHSLFNKLLCEGEQGE